MINYHPTLQCSYALSLTTFMASKSIDIETVVLLSSGQVTLISTVSPTDLERHSRISIQDQMSQDYLI